MDNLIEISLSASGGMNQDDSIITPPPGTDGISLFSSGDYKYALNARVGASRSDHLGDIENIRGTLEVTNYYVYNGTSFVTGNQPSGNSRTRSKFEDRSKHRFYYLRYNDQGNHTICEFRPSENAVYELIRDSRLAFQDKYFSCTKLNNFLCFTDRNLNPRIVDVTSISALHYSLGSNFREFHLSLHKYQPIHPPIVRYLEGTSGQSPNNKLRDGLFQFSFRYVYKGGFKSCWSPRSTWNSIFYIGSGSLASDNPLQSFTVVIPGFITDDLTQTARFNFFRHDDIRFYLFVDYIDIAFRNGDRDVWKLFKRYTVLSSSGTFIASDFNKTFSFTNDINGAPIPANEIKQTFDNVPLQSGCVETIDNRIVLSDNQEEFPTVTNFGVENVTLYSSNQIAWENIVDGTLFTGLTAVQQNILLGINRARRQGWKARGIYKFGIVFSNGPGRTSLVYTDDTFTMTIPPNDVSSPNSSYTQPNYAIGFNFKSSFTPPEWATSYQIVRTNCLNISYFIYGFINKFIYLVDDISSIDDLATTPADRSQITIDYFNSNSDPNFKLSSRMAAATRKTKEISDLSKASRIYIDINNWNSASKLQNADENSPMNNIYYNFQDGDRVVFFGSTVASPTDSQIVAYDVPILEFTGRSLIIDRPDDLLWLPDNNAFRRYYCIEVYRPKIANDASDLTFYEMGEWYPILYPGTSSRTWSKSDWRWNGIDNVTAIQQLSEYEGIVDNAVDMFTTYLAFINYPLVTGDCHQITKSFYYDWESSDRPGYYLDVFTHAMNPDPRKIWDYWEKCNGRPFVAYDTYPNTNFKETQTRFSQKFLQDSLINGINTFLYQDQNIYPSEYGRIRAMRNVSNALIDGVGNILLMIGENETWSVYVNRTQLTDLGGNSQVVLSDKVLGSFNTLRGSHGTWNPESVSQEGGRVWFWNVLKGTWVRYSQDGLTAISKEYKMQTWFAEIGNLTINQYNQGSDPIALSDYDIFNQELIVYNDHSSMPSTLRGYSTYKGVIFNEGDKRWKFVHSYAPEIFGKVNSTVLASFNGRLYMLENGDEATSYNNFFGVKYPTQIEFVGNEFPKWAKVWQTISVIGSGDRWSVERFLTEKFSNTTQLSRLDLDAAEDKEGVFWAAIQNDQNTPNLSSGQSALVSGDKMRSKALRVLLQLDTSVISLSLLHYLVIGFINSPKNVSSK